MRTLPPTIAMKPVDGRVASLARTLSSPACDQPTLRGSAIDCQSVAGKTATLVVVVECETVDGVVQATASEKASASRPELRAAYPRLRDRNPDELIDEAEERKDWFARFRITM